MKAVFDVVDLYEFLGGGRCRQADTQRKTDDGDPVHHQPPRTRYPRGGTVPQKSYTYFRIVAVTWTVSPRSDVGSVDSDTTRGLPLSRSGSTFNCVPRPSV